MIPVMGRVTGGWKATAAGALLALGLVTGCGGPVGGGEHDESWRAPSAPPSLSPGATSSAPVTPSPSVSRTPSGSPSATGPASPGGPTTTPASGSGGGSGGEVGGTHGNGGGGSGGGGEPDPPIAPAPPSQQAPAGGTDGFPYDGDLCAGGDHGPYLQVYGGSGKGQTAQITAREGHFTCDGKDDPRWTATGAAAGSLPLNENAHITVTTPFVPAGQRKAMTANEFLARISSYGAKQVLVFHYQTDPERVWILNQIDPGQY